MRVSSLSGAQHGNHSSRFRLLSVVPISFGLPIAWALSRGCFGRRKVLRTDRRAAYFAEFCPVRVMRIAARTHRTFQQCAAFFTESGVRLVFIVIARGYFRPALITINSRFFVFRPALWTHHGVPLSFCPRMARTPGSLVKVNFHPYSFIIPQNQPGINSYKPNARRARTLEGRSRPDRRP